MAAVYIVIGALVIVDRVLRRLAQLDFVAHLLNFRVLFFEAGGEILLLLR